MYRTVIDDLVLRRGDDTDVDRASAMLMAVHKGDVGRQQRLLDAAATRGIDLRARLVRAKLLRDHRGVLRVGDAAPTSLQS